MIDQTTLTRYRVNAYRKWFDSVPPRPAASLAIVRPGRGTQARKRLDTLARV
jgi:hypothetical protein